MSVIGKKKFSLKKVTSNKKATEIPGTQAAIF